MTDAHFTSPAVSVEAQRRSALRIEDLTQAVFESQMEAESLRTELAQLRHAEPPASSLDDFRRTIHSLTQDASRSSDLVKELREDLRQAEREIEKGHQVLLLSREAQQAPTQDTESLSPTSTGGRRRDSTMRGWNGKASVASAEDEGLGDIMREQVIGLKSMIETLTDDNQELWDKNNALVTESLELR